jgi:hypothetical protein
MNGIQLSYDITHGALQTQVPIELPYAPWCIHDQKWPKTIKNMFCGDFYLHNLIF